jgi:protein-tyrosine-phosphatase
MRVLFVCRGNVARSQMAEAAYNRFSQSRDADSAGTRVEKPGETLLDRKRRLGQSYVVDTLIDNGYSLDDMRQTPLTKEMLSRYDIIICMAAKQFTPQWLSDAPQFQYWKIQDPKARSYDRTNRTRLKIEARVRELIEHGRKSADR